MMHGTTNIKFSTFFEVYVWLYTFFVHLSNIQHATRRCNIIIIIIIIIIIFIFLHGLGILTCSGIDAF